MLIYSACLSLRSIDSWVIFGGKHIEVLYTVDDGNQWSSTCLRYYTGEKQAPVLTIVIGGNHEASNYFWEL